MTTETTIVAKMCHAANKAWCELHGDMSQPEWDVAPSWQKESAILGVEFHRENPTAGDSASHDSWMAQKVSDGWAYGIEKDPVRKTHPCMVPFSELPHQQRKKDAIFRAMVHALGDAE